MTEVLSDQPHAHAAGEQPGVHERVIVAPALGVFRPVAEPDGSAGTDVDEGQTVGVVIASGEEIPVRSAFRGRLMGMLAVTGERVREGQPVAWLRTL